MKRTIHLALIFLLIGNPSFSQFEINWLVTFDGSSTDNPRKLFQSTNGNYFISGTSGSNDLGPATTNGSGDFFFLQLNENQNIEELDFFGGSDSDNLYDMIESQEGGYLMIGSSQSIDGDVGQNFGKADYWILKIDESRDIEWKITYGDSLWDEARSVVQSLDGDYYVLGRKYSEETQDDIVLLKINQTGEIIWEQQFGGELTDEPSKIIETMDGNLIILSTYSSSDINGDPTIGQSDYNVLKISKEGDLIWQKNYGGSSSDVANSIIENDLGELLLVGRTFSNDFDAGTINGISDFGVIKLTKDGDLVWKETYGGADVDNPYDVIFTTNQTYVIAGVTRTPDIGIDNYGTHDGWLVEINEQGDIINTASFDGPDSDQIQSVLESDNGSFVVCGTKAINNGVRDFWLAEIKFTTSVKNSILQNKIQVYPNPTEGLINIIAVDYEIMEMTIVNILGEKIRHYPQPQNRININELNNGVYFLNLRFKDALISKKIVLNK